MMMKLMKLKKMNQEMVQTRGPKQVNHWSLSYQNILKISILANEHFISITSRNTFHRKNYNSNIYDQRTGYSVSWFYEELN